MSNFESSSRLVKSCCRIQNFLKNKLFDRNNFNNIQNDQYATQLQDRNWACQNGAEKLNVGDSKLNNLYNKYENKIAKNNRYHNSYKIFEMSTIQRVKMEIFFKIEIKLIKIQNI
jgi:hypothetical protein